MVRSRQGPHQVEMAHGLVPAVPPRPPPSVPLYKRVLVGGDARPEARSRVSASLPPSTGLASLSPHEGRRGKRGVTLAGHAPGMGARTHAVLAPGGGDALRTAQRRVITGADRQQDTPPGAVHQEGCHSLVLREPRRVITPLQIERHVSRALEGDHREALAEWLSATPADIRLLLRGQLATGRTQELPRGRLAAGMPR
jgi:hypothetical protein